MSTSSARASLRNKLSDCVPLPVTDLDMPLQPLTRPRSLPEDSTSFAADVEHSSWDYYQHSAGSQHDDRKSNNAFEVPVSKNNRRHGGTRRQT